MPNMTANYQDKFYKDYEKIILERNKYKEHYKHEKLRADIDEDNEAKVRKVYQKR